MYIGKTCALNSSGTDLDKSLTHDRPQGVGVQKVTDTISALFSSNWILTIYCLLLASI